MLAFGTRANLDLVPGLAEHALPLKLVGDAMFIRNRVLQRVARIELETRSGASGARLGHFIVIGGGFSGVEVAGELADFLRGALRYYPRVRRRRAAGHAAAGRRPAAARAARVARPRRRALADGARHRRAARGARGARSTPTASTLAERRVASTARTVICTIGTQPNPLVERLGAAAAARPHRHRARPVGAAARASVWAIGDCALDPQRSAARARAVLRAADRAVRGRRGARAGAQHRRRASRGRPTRAVRPRRRRE